MDHLECFCDSREGCIGERYGNWANGCRYTGYNNTSVGTVMGRDVRRGQLLAAFKRVENADNWKAPIDARIVIRSDFEMEMIREAVRFFTGSAATIECERPPVYRVRAIGYYKAVGA